jgi:hypothetical protein
MAFLQLFYQTLKMVLLGALLFEQELLPKPRIEYNWLLERASFVEKRLKAYVAAVKKC